MAEHPLVVTTKDRTTDPDRHRQAADVAAVVQPLLDEALACEDAACAREVLPVALVTLYRETRALLGMELIRATWVDAQHAALYRKAQQLFGAEARHVVQPPPHELFSAPAVQPGRLFPR
jgi:hypothetical protein